MFAATTQKNSLSHPEKSVEPKLKCAALVGNFPPRRCGIAVFTSDLFEALKTARPALECVIVAMNDGAGAYAYDSDVSIQIDQDSVQHYVEAADSLNLSGAQVVCLQHEFGIFGGEAGAHV